MASVQVPIPFCLPPAPPSSAPFPELLRPLPSPNRTIEEWFVYKHKDLPTMSPSQLKAEAVAVEQRIAFEGRSNCWFFERLMIVRGLLVQAEGVKR